MKRSPIIILALILFCAAGIFVYTQHMTNKIQANIVGIWMRDYTQVFHNDTRDIYEFREDGSGTEVVYDRFNEEVCQEAPITYEVKFGRLYVHRSSRGILEYTFESAGCFSLNGKETYYYRQSCTTMEQAYALSSVK